MTTRRQFLRLLALGGSATLVTACSTPPLVPSATSLASPGTPPSLATGLQHSPAPQPEGGSSFVDVAIDSIRVNPENQRRVMLLQEVGSRRYLPIWIGHFEADAIAIPMQQIPTTYPLSHALMLDLVAAAGSRVHEVRIDRLEAKVFYATIVLATAAGMRAVEARPADAVALALRAGAPIRVATDVLEAAGLDFEASEDSPEEPTGDPTDRDRPLEAAREDATIEPTAAGPDLDVEVVEVEVDSMRVHRTNNHRVVILKDKTSRRIMPIWIGDVEAHAIAIPLHGVPVTHPLTHPLMLALLQAAGSRVREARIDRLIDETFEGSVVLETAQGTRAVLARPSDGIALALYASAPIKVATTVMQQAGLLFECDPAEEPDDPDAEAPGSGAAPPPIRVLVVAAESQERQRLYGVLKSDLVTPMPVGASPDIAVVGGARTGAEALRLLSERRPDVVLVTTDLPDMSGVDLCQRLCDERPGVAVAMVAGSAEADVVRACVRAGARGYLLPRNLPGGSSDRTLVPAVRALALGQAAFAPRAAVPLLNPAQWDETSGDLRLSLNRWQREVLRLIARGHSDQEIDELWQPNQLSEGARAVLRWEGEVLRVFTERMEKLSPDQVSEGIRESQRLREAMSDRDIAERLHLSQSTLTEVRQEIAEWSRARWQPVVLGLEVLDEVRRSGWAQSTVAG